MKNLSIPLLLTLLMTVNTPAYGDMASSPAKKEQAVLSIKKMWDQGTSCVYAVRLHNPSSFHIRSVVAELTAILEENVTYRSVSEEFFEIEPSNEQTREFQFFEISCSEIFKLKVHIDNHCTMGSLNKISSTSEECGKLIRVDSSTLVQIYKEH